MAHKLTKERIKELEKDEERRRNSKATRLKRYEQRQKQKAIEEENWIEKIKKRGGFIPKKAKRWGDLCTHNECEKCEDGECAYRGRETEGCYLERKT